ncbi:MAG: biopolymer transporter ExbD [Chitinophagaceae bacterium]
MPKVKVPRKSTSVDMTAMCDVAFLLLSFFILTTKFKSEDIEISTPTSVSTKPVDEKDVVLVSLDKEGHVYFSVSDNNAAEKEQIIDAVAQQKGLTLSDQEKKAFTRAGSFVGVPFSQLQSYLKLTPEQMKAYKAPGIPIDSTNNEMSVWLGAAMTAFQGSKMNVMVKGDNDAKYSSFKGIIDALKKNEILKFQLVTDPEGVPPGTELWNKNQQTGSKGATE